MKIINKSPNKRTIEYDVGDEVQTLDGKIGVVVETHSPYGVGQRILVTLSDGSNEDSPSGLCAPLSVNGSGIYRVITYPENGIPWGAIFQEDGDDNDYGHVGGSATWVTSYLQYMAEKRQVA